MDNSQKENYSRYHAYSSRVVEKLNLCYYNNSDMSTHVRPSVEQLIIGTTSSIVHVTQWFHIFFV